MFQITIKNSSGKPIVYYYLWAPYHISDMANLSIKPIVPLFVLATWQPRVTMKLVSHNFMPIKLLNNAEK